MQPQPFQDTQPAALDAGGAGGKWAEFLVRDSAELLRLMKQLRDGSVPVSLNSPDGSAVGGQVWSLDTQAWQLSFVTTASSTALQRLADADEAVAVAYLDSVKLQFDLHGMLLVHGPSGCALRAGIPQQLYRFQRRSSYRLRGFGRQPPTARLRHPSLPDIRMSLRIVDLSVGGCALSLPSDMPALQPGSRLQGVRIDLDAQSGFDATLQLQHVSALQGGVRLGCEFHDLDGAAQRLLQRYIDHAQQRRRLLALR